MSEAKEEFEKIKEAILSTPGLDNPDMSKDFIIVVYAIDFSIATY